ncbi:hypothetical protein BDY21DRAFT_361730 [Lineolata rhizophorae]|uniref:Uncharacterized protein n=1 Tax=Lineolata rhizophorae TaxID=578093 RepID=A0A6A6P7M7_9PEZI|nr:hypothetical protein BDY21DRAFT_361730 [Lineolata rhizophorae]
MTEPAALLARPRCASAGLHFGNSTGRAFCRRIWRRVHPCWTVAAARSSGLNLETSKRATARNRAGPAMRSALAPCLFSTLARPNLTSLDFPEPLVGRRTTYSASQVVVIDHWSALLRRDVRAFGGALCGG